MLAPRLHSQARAEAGASSDISMQTEKSALDIGDLRGGTCINARSLSVPIFVHKGSCHGARGADEADDSVAPCGGSDGIVPALLQHVDHEPERRRLALPARPCRGAERAR